MTQHAAHRVGLGLLALAATVSFILPDFAVPASRAAEPLPDDVELIGILRDFSSSHGDFAVVPTVGIGHYAGTVGPTLSADDRPEFDLLGGYKVMQQWTNAFDQNIPPHLAQVAGADAVSTVAGNAFFVNGDVYLQQGDVDGPGDGAIIVTNSTVADSVQLLDNMDLIGSIYVGPGGDPDTIVHQSGNSSISGAVGVMAEAFEVPTVAAPGGMGPSEGDVTFSGGTISSDRHFDEFTVRQNETVTIQGDVTILCDDFEMQNNSSLELADGAILTLYVSDGVDLRNNTRLNSLTADPSRASLIYLGSGDLTLTNSHDMWGTILAPDGHLHVINHATLTGAFLVDRLTLDNGSSALHMMAGATVSTSGGTLSCGAYEDNTGAAGVSNDGAISTEASFLQWFADDLDANLSAWHPIALTGDGDGNYVFSALDTFYPLDDLAGGNEGEEHNHYFTYAISARFEFEECTGQYVQFHGGDGMWLFIDGRLAIDLGGVQANTPQRIDLDRLGLIDGEMYDFHLFFASRNAATSTFDLRTNLVLQQDLVLATVTSQYD